MKHLNKHEDDLIEMLATAIEAQSAPWQKPWKCDARLPTNLITGKVYTRRNLLMLSTAGALAGYNDHRWAGFHQIKSGGGHVRRASTATGSASCGAAAAVAASTTATTRTSLGTTREDTDDPATRKRAREYTYTTFRPVWNAAQCEGIAPLEDGPKSCLYI